MDNEPVRYDFSNVLGRATRARLRTAGALPVYNLPLKKYIFFSAIEYNISVCTRGCGTTKEKTLHTNTTTNEPSPGEALSPF